VPHLPFMQFYPADYIRDTRRLDPSTRGHWVDLLCAMWDAPKRGQLYWTVGAFSRHLGVSVETARQVLVSLLDTNTADGEFVGDADGPCPVDCKSDHRGDEEDIRSGACFGFVRNCQEHVRLLNRRMVKDEKTREDNRKYKKKSRDRKKSGSGHADVNGIYHISEVRSQKSEKIKKKIIHPILGPKWGDPEKLIEKYNSETPAALPAVEKITPARLKKAREYLKIFPDESFWTETFREIGKSDFLQGMRNGNGHGSFKANFDWLLTKGKDGTENVVKIFEGRYTNGK